MPPHVHWCTQRIAGSQTTQQSKPKPLLNNDSIHHTMSFQCFRLQLLLGSQGTATVKATGLVLIMEDGEEGGNRGTNRVLEMSFYDSRVGYKTTEA